MESIFLHQPWETVAAELFRNLQKICEYSVIGAPIFDRFGFSLVTLNDHDDKRGS